MCLLAGASSGFAQDTQASRRFIRIDDVHQLQAGGQYAVACVGTNTDYYPCYYKLDSSNQLAAAKIDDNAITADMIWTFHEVSDKRTCSETNTGHNVGPMFAMSQTVDGQTCYVKFGEEALTTEYTSANDFELCPAKNTTSIGSETGLYFVLHATRNAAGKFTYVRGVQGNNSSVTGSAFSTWYELTNWISSGNVYSTVHKVYLAVTRGNEDVAARALWNGKVEAFAAEHPTYSAAKVAEVLAFPSDATWSFDNVEAQVDELFAAKIPSNFVRVTSDDMLGGGVRYALGTIINKAYDAATFEANKTSDWHPRFYELNSTNNNMTMTAVNTTASFPESMLWRFHRAEGHDCTSHTTGQGPVFTFSNGVRYAKFIAPTNNTTRTAATVEVSALNSACYAEFCAKDDATLGHVYRIHYTISTEGNAYNQQMGVSKDGAWGKFGKSNTDFLDSHDVTATGYNWALLFQVYAEFNPFTPEVTAQDIWNELCEQNKLGFKPALPANDWSSDLATLIAQVNTAWEVWDAARCKFEQINAPAQLGAGGNYVVQPVWTDATGVRTLRLASPTSTAVQSGQPAELDATALWHFERLEGDVCQGSYCHESGRMFYLRNGDKYTTLNTNGVVSLVNDAASARKIELVPYTQTPYGIVYKVHYNASNTGDDYKVGAFNKNGTGFGVYSTGDVNSKSSITGDYTTYLRISLMMDDKAPAALWDCARSIAAQATESESMSEAMLALQCPTDVEWNLSSLAALQAQIDELWASAVASITLQAEAVREEFNEQKAHKLATAQLYAPILGEQSLGEINGMLNALTIAENATDAEATAALESLEAIDINSEVMQRIDHRIIYVLNHLRSNEKYLTRTAAGNLNTEALPIESSAWMIVASEDGQHFSLCSPETNTYISNTLGMTSAAAGYAMFNLVEGTAEGTVALQFLNASYQPKMICVDLAGNNAVQSDANSGADWTVTLAGKKADELEAGKTYRIRSLKSMHDYITTGSLLGINTYVDDSEQVADSNQIKNRKRNGMGTLWTLEAAAGGKYYIRNRAAINDTHAVMNGIGAGGANAINNPGSFVIEQAAVADPTALAVKSGDKYLVTPNPDNVNGVGLSPSGNTFDAVGNVFYFEEATDVATFEADYIALAQSRTPIATVENYAKHPAIWPAEKTQKALSDIAGLGYTQPATVKEANTVVSAEVTAVATELYNSADGRKVHIKSHDYSEWYLANGTQYVTGVQNADLQLGSIWILRNDAANGGYKLENYLTGTQCTNATADETQMPLSATGHTFDLVPSSVGNDATILISDKRGVAHSYYHMKANNHGIVKWGASSGSHWIVSLADDVANAEVTIGLDFSDGKHLITISHTDGLALHDAYHASHVITVAKQRPSTGNNAPRRVNTADNGDISAIHSDATVTNDNTITIDLDKKLEQGTYEVTIPMGFFKVGNNSLSKEMTATFDVSNAGTVTGMEELTTINYQPSTIYDLQGRKLSKPTRGINIINGRKVRL